MLDRAVTRVVAALIVEDGRILICQRPAHKARGLLWEFPGGKVEPGETPEAALVRECMEELDILVQADEIYAEVLFPYPDLMVQLTLWRSRILSGSPKNLEHQEILWVKPDEMGEYPFCPADIDLIKKILEDDQRGLFRAE